MSLSLSLSLFLLFRASVNYSPDDNPPITCADEGSDRACSVYSTALLNADIYDVGASTLVRLILKCIIEEKHLPDPRKYGLSQSNIPDLLDCKERTMYDEYGITEDLDYASADEGSPFTGYIVKAASPLECVVGRHVVLTISNTVNSGGFNRRSAHMIKCTITECKTSETVLLCRNYAAQGGGQYTVTIYGSGLIGTNPNTNWNGRILGGIIYVR